MPRISRWFIRTALVYLALGFSIGALMMWNKGLPIHSAITRLIPLHRELLLVAWTMQLVMGVALWIFPRFGTPLAYHRRDTAAWAAFGTINVGAWLAGLGPLLATPTGAAIVLAGRLAECASAALFAAAIRRRIRASGLSAM